MRLSDDNLHGRSVIASDGLEIGVVTLLFLDSTAWQVESLQIRLHRDAADRLGADHNVFRAGAVEVPNQDGSVRR